MTTFNTNVTSRLGSRTTIGPTKIRSPTRYSDMFVGAENDVIESMLERSDRGPSQLSASAVSYIPARKVAPVKVSRYESLRRFERGAQAIQTTPDVHYRIVETVQGALDAAVMLADFHSISVMWEGFDVNRHGVLTWIICGYLGSAVLFNVHKCGPKIFTEGGLKTLLEARHPIKVIHDCSCLADILLNQYNVMLSSESIFDTHAADLLIQTKASQDLAAKTLTECLIEYQDIPISVYRQRESIMKQEGSVWVWDNIPPDLLLATARTARYAALLHGVMLRELSKPLPQITEIYLNYRFQERSPDPKTRVRQIPPDVETLLIETTQKRVVRTEWNIPETVLNPVYDPQPGEEHFYSKPFKFDPKKATPGSLKIFSVNPNRPVPEDDDDWERFVQPPPRYPPEVEEDERDTVEEASEAEQSARKRAAARLSISEVFKVPDIFSDVSSSSCSRGGDVPAPSRDLPDHVTFPSRDLPDHVSSSETSTSSSDDNVNIIIPKCELPPTVAATLDPSLMGSKMIWPGEEGYNDPNHKVPVMSAELSALVEKVRAEQKSKQGSVLSKAFISAEEMRRSMEEERQAAITHSYNISETGSVSRHSSEAELAPITENREIIGMIEPHYEIRSDSSSSSDVILDQGSGFNVIPRCFVKQSSVLRTTPRQVTSSRQSPGASFQTSNNQFPTSKPQCSTASNPPPLFTPVRKTRSLIDPVTTTLALSPTAAHRNLSLDESRDQHLPYRAIPTFSQIKSPISISSSSENDCFRSENVQQAQIHKSINSNNPGPVSATKAGVAKRPPLVIIPKYRPGRGRGNPQPGVIPPPPLVPATSLSPQHTGPIFLPKGRGRAAAISDRTVSRDFHEQHSVARSPQHSPQHSTMRSPQHSTMRSPQHSTMRSPQHSTTHSPQRSTMRSPQHSPQHSTMRSPQRSTTRSASPDLDFVYHHDFYGAGVTVSPECVETENSAECGVETENTCSSVSNSVRSTHKAHVSLCLAYDSDDPENY